METLIVRQFTAESDRGAYDRFHDIRVSVFSAELGWRLRSGDGRWHDPFDNGARLSMAEVVDGPPIGILRTLRASQVFPHRELFEAHLDRAGLAGREHLIGTLNALAVLPQHRRRSYRSRDDGAIGTAAILMLQSSVRELELLGVPVVLATVLGPASARAFLRVGFRLLDAPRGMPGQTGFSVANVGAVLGGSSADVAGVAQYFESCHRRVTAMGDVDELFALACAMAS